jgi:hypothetical protein
MSHTYQAILRGDRLEWRDAPPKDLVPEQPVAVHVTILDQADQAVQPSRTGQQMAAILGQLAHSQALAGIADPVAWQRMVREDRELPDRDS